MPIHLTVDALAQMAANNSISPTTQLPAGLDRQIVVLRNKYDFKVTGFNASTVVLVVSVALLILTSKMLFVAVACIALFARTAILADLESNRVGQVANLIDRARQLLGRFGFVNPVAGWNPDEVVMLNQVIWKNWLPPSFPPANGAAPAGGALLAGAGQVVVGIAHRVENLLGGAPQNGAPAGAPQNEADQGPAVQNHLIAAAAAVGNGIANGVGHLVQMAGPALNQNQPGQEEQPGLRRQDALVPADWEDIRADQIPNA